MQQSPWGPRGQNKSLQYKEWKEKDKEGHFFAYVMLLSPEKYNRIKFTKFTNKRFSKLASFKISKQNQLFSSYHNNQLEKKI